MPKPQKKVFRAIFIIEVVGDEDTDFHKLLNEETEFLAEPKSASGCVEKMTLEKFREV